MVNKISINAKDNTVVELHELVSVKAQEQDALKEYISQLGKFQGKPLKDLIKDNPSLLIFPTSLIDVDAKSNPADKNQEDDLFTQDKIEDEVIYSLSGDCGSAETVKIATTNLMGFIGLLNVKLSITSRFAHDNYFLYYMLQKVFCVNLFDFNFDKQLDGTLDLLSFLFPYALKRALKKGLYKEYRRFQRNDSKVKGPISVARHLKENMPFKGTVAYDSRERTFDNNINQLVRHTIEYIKKSAFRSILSSDKDTRFYVSQVVEATPSFNPQSKSKILHHCLKPFKSPFFTEYSFLIKLCKSILNHEKIEYSQKDDEIYGLLFDGAWLWEEYLATILTNLEKPFVHPENKLKNGGIQLYKEGQRSAYPDFYRGNQIVGPNNPTVAQGKTDLKSSIDDNWIVDAKYKSLDTYGVSRDDKYQLIAYMHTFPSNKGTLVYPFSQDNQSGNQKEKSYSLCGFGGKLSTYGVNIVNKVNSYEEFCRSMEKAETELIAKFST